MDYVAVAKSLSVEDIVGLLKLREEFDSIKSQLKFFQDQLFGQKSEKRKEISNSAQLSLGGLINPTKPDSAPVPRKEIITYERKQRSKGKLEGNVNKYGGLSFDESVVVKSIKIPAPEIKDLNPDEYELIKTNYHYELAQKPASYMVIEHIQDVVKINDKIVTAPRVGSVLSGSYADVSLLANLIIDKFQYHLPLYRQHQRIAAAGIKISRVSLTNYVHQSLDLLEQIYYAQLDSIKSGDTLWMDETPIKAGHNKEKKKLKSGYIWSLYGKKKEVAFWYHESRGTKVIMELLAEDFKGTLVTDGYEAYSNYTKELSTVEHAMCWSHTRRLFLKAEELQPELVTKVLKYIRLLYQVEESIKNGTPEQILEARGEKSKEIIDQFSVWLRAEANSLTLLPSDLFTKACNYFFKHEAELRVFLSNPSVTIDTNHLEREIRPIAIGRKNWLFCWTEIGAHYAAIAYSLIATCKLHDVKPYEYLVDVLQRVKDHPHQQIQELIPRNWKQNFQHKKLISAIDL